MGLVEGFRSHQRDQEAKVLRAIIMWEDVDVNGPAIEVVKHQASLGLRRGQVSRAISRLENRGTVKITKPGPDTPYGSIVGKRVKLNSV